VSGGTLKRSNSLIVPLNAIPLQGSAWCLAVAVNLLGLFQEAVLSYDRALDIDARDVTAWTNMGLFLNRHRCEHEAIACFENVRELSGVDTQRDIVR
jgi:tetratricopeptide (TPR) repeat protein